MDATLVKQTGWMKPSILPGFALALGFTLLYLAIVVLIPLSSLFVQTAGVGMPTFWKTVAAPRVLHAFKISFCTSLVAAFVNLVFGLIIAWVLVRYRFPGKRLIDAAIDLPFALPTAVAGIVLTTLYAPMGWIGRYLAPLGIKIAFTPLGIVVALVFVGLPFVVRTVQPVLEDMDKEREEAAACLGATRGQTFFAVVLPHVMPALMTGFLLAFARALGEYGSVIFIAGNLPGISEIVPLVIVTKLEQFDYAGATAVALLMLLASFVLLLSINTMQKRLRGGREM